MITGGNGVIGKAIAQAIADKGYSVVLACRDEAKAHQAVEDLIRVTGNREIRYELVDVSRQSSIQDLAGRWKSSLDVLINNAATTPRHRHETPEGIELQFATNVLGYFWMALAFRQPLKDAAPSRIVNVASYYAGDLDLNDLEFKRRRYDNNRAYRQSKQANRMLTVALAERLIADGISVNACHPGNPNSRLSNDLGFGGHDRPKEAARTPVWLATEPAGQQQTGQYFEHQRAVQDPYARDRQAIEALYQTCLQVTQGSLREIAG